MEVSYRRRFHQSYMILEGGQEPEEPCELTVLAYNRIPGLLPMETEIADGKVRFWYDITGKQNLTDYLGRREVDGQLLELLFQGMETVCRQLQEHLLEESQLVLKPEHLYLDFSGKKLGVVYLPGYHEDIRDSFRELMELLLRRLDHSDKRGAAVAYEMYQLSLQKEMSFSDMLRQAAAAGQAEENHAEMTGDPSTRYADVIGGSKEQYEEYAGIAQKQAEGSAWNAAETYQQKTEKPWKQKPWKQSRPVMVHSPAPGKEKTGPFARIKVHFEERGLRSGREQEWKNSFRAEDEDLPYVTAEEKAVTYPTEILCGGDGPQGILKYLGSGGQQDITVEKDSFLLGKETGEVDGRITGKSVSRIHARISREDEDYYLEDMNSTNGTYLNGEQLEYRQKVKLEAKDRITFGMEEYIFL